MAFYWTEYIEILLLMAEGETQILNVMLNYATVSSKSLIY